jgi:hypothetical protein
MRDQTNQNIMCSHSYLLSTCDCDHATGQRLPTIEQYKMTKNAHSEEYLVACADRKEDSDERINKLLARYPK